MSDLRIAARPSFAEGGLRLARAAETEQEVPSALTAALSATSTPTLETAKGIMQALCAYHDIPWRLGWVLLEHEGGLRYRAHGDGVMQTTRSARKATVPTIPRELKLALVALPATDDIGEDRLNAKVLAAFAGRLGVQIACGVQELVNALRAFRGYVTLAFVAYNAGPGWAAWVATGGAAKRRPQETTDEQWEERCRFAAALYHQLPSALRIPDGVYQCDSNIPAWYRRFAVFDRQSGQQLIAYQYLRSVPARIREHKPTLPPEDWANNKRREPGGGALISVTSRVGTLEKVYDTARLRSDYAKAVAGELAPILDDQLPLRADGGNLVKMPLTSGN